MTSTEPTTDEMISGVVTSDEVTSGEVNSGAWFEHSAARIYYEESGSPAGPAILFLPGLTDTVRSYIDLRSQAAEKGMRVIAADLPGSGKSLPQPRAYSPTYYAEDAEALAALIGQLAAAPVVLVGCSDGGEVALVIAATHPELVKGVLAWGAVGSIQDAEGKNIALFRTIIDNPPAGVEGYRDYLIAAYGEEGARITTQSAADAFAAMLEAGGDIIRAKASQIVAPTLLLAGEHDPFVPAAALHELNAAIPNGRVLIVEGGDHALHRSYPALMRDVLHTFLFTIHAYPETPVAMH